MGTGKIIGLCVLIFLIGAFISTMICLDSWVNPSRNVEVRLVNAVSEDGKHAWEFLVDGKEIPAGEKITVFNNFPISVKEFYSRKITDNINIGNILEHEDIITYRYFSPTSEEGERIFVEIQHKDGTITWVSLNIY